MAMSTYDVSSVKDYSKFTAPDGEPYTLFATVLATMHVVGINELTDDSIQIAESRVKELGRRGICLITPRRGRPRAAHDLDSRFRRNLTVEELRLFKGLKANTVPVMSDDQFFRSVEGWFAIDR